MLVLFSQASGIIINNACGNERPDKCKSSNTSSKLAESLMSGEQIGNARSRPGIMSLSSSASRVAIQLRFPCTVLISPLWAMYRYGCASGHDGNVFVEKRLCTIARHDSMRSSHKSGKKSPSSGVVNIPLYTKVRDDNEEKYVRMSPTSADSMRLRGTKILRSRSMPCAPAGSSTKN